MGTPRYRVSVDPTLCIGCGLCEETMPDLFQLGDYTASVADSSVSGDRMETLTVVTRDCPVGAIDVVPTGSPDEESGRAPGDDDQERKDEEEGGEIREYQRKHGYVADRNVVEPDDSERLQSREHNFSIVRNGTNDN